MKKSKKKKSVSKKKPDSKKKSKIKPGSVVIFEPKNFNPEYWQHLTEQDKIKYYAPLGYGSKKIKLFVFVSEILNPDNISSGHCVLLDLDDGHLEYMRHTSDFRLATEDEF